MQFFTILFVFLVLIFNLEAQNDNANQPEITGKFSIPQGPQWIHNAVFYEIYPQTFYDSNGDGIGDLPGIIQKLDYVKSLGVTAIWLNPFYESPFRDAGYDVSNFYKVAPRYGTNDDVKKLFEEIHKRGLRVIIDFVPGHTSIDHPWFKASCDPKPNKYSNWYIWTKGTWFAGMDNYKNGFIQGYCERDGNYMTNFFWHQPALNYGYSKPDPAQPWQLSIDHPDVIALKDEMQNVMKFWLDYGCDGFRVDMAGSLVKGSGGGEECSKYWKKIRTWIDKEYPNAFLISEWSYPLDALSGGFHADFLHWFDGYNDLFQRETERNPFSKGTSFFDKAGKGNIDYFLQTYLKQYIPTLDKGYISLPVGNHDLIRIKNHGRTDEDLEIIFAFMMTMPGIPFIYYGDEIGMKQLNSTHYREGSYGTRAGARTPMQWTNGKNNGFSSTEPEKLWQITDNDANAPNVEQAEKNKNSLLYKVKKLIELKTKEPALAGYAEFVPLIAKPSTYPYVFIRAAGNSRLLIVLNPSESDVAFSLDSKYYSAKAKLIAGQELKNDKKNKTSIDLTSKGVSYSIYKLQ